MVAAAGQCGLGLPPRGCTEDWSSPAKGADRTHWDTARVPLSPLPKPEPCTHGKWQLCFWFLGLGPFRDIFRGKRWSLLVSVGYSVCCMSLFQAEGTARKASRVGVEGAQLLPCSQSYSHGYFGFSPQAMLKADALGVW